MPTESNIGATRFDLFITLTAGIPPSRNALQIHILKSAYQSGWVRGNTLSATNPPLVTDWGWEIVPEEEPLISKLSMN